jgi:hypothetical protein
MNYIAEVKHQQFNDSLHLHCCHGTIEAIEQYNLNALANK